MTEISEHHWLFSKNPKHDFMRQNTGKLSLYDTMHLILTMGKGNTSDEIIDYFDLDYDAIPTNSAFIQRRNQIMLSAFEYLFSEFSSSFPEITRKFKGHSILAVMVPMFVILRMPRSQRTTANRIALPRRDITICT